MEVKGKYPKSFYNDGLGDLLEFIDDEILVHSDKLASRKQSIDESEFDQGSKSRRKKIKREKLEKKELYGDNLLAEKHKPSRRIEFDLSEEPDVEANKRLEDQARGLINRLTAQTMPFVTSEFEKLYSGNSRSTVNESLFLIVWKSLIHDHAIAKRKLVAELMILISYLNTKISHGIGASFVHQLFRRLEKLLSNKSDNKQSDNIIICIVNLYFIGLISSNVIFEVTRRICSRDFRSKSVEILLLIVKSVGFQLRKDNPSSMRQFILNAQESCKKLKGVPDIDKRVEFMVEALSAIKNNNASKIGNYGCDIDKDTIESTLKNLLKRTKLPEHLSDATYEEILNSPNWYLLETRLAESSQEVKQNEISSIDRVIKDSRETKAESKVCKALGLSKPAEKTVFSALLRVSDCVEATNILIGFGFNHCSDVMLVCIHVAVYEKKYNPFYYEVINNLCKFNRRYKMAAKFSVQDKIRVLGKMPSQRVDIFKTLCLELIKSDAVPITILKSIEWADLSSSTKEFLVYLLEGISELTDEEKQKIMSKTERRSSFAGAMRTFANCFMKGCKLFS